MKLDEIEKKQVFERTYAQNMRLLYFVPFIAIPVTIGHILFFFFKNTLPETDEFIWRMGIIFSHLSVLIVSLFVGWVAINFRKKGKPGIRIGNILIIFFYAFILLVGIVIVAFDQMVTPAITPFFLICTVLAIVFLVNPKHAFLLYLAAYFLFFFAIGITQENAALLLSNRVNGFTVVCLGFFISFVIWKNTMQKYRQAILIEKQSDSLLQHNRELVEKSSELEKAISTKDKLFSIIGHDLKSPLSAIMNLLEITDESISKGDLEKAKKFSQTSLKASRQAMSLLDNLLEWSQSHSQNKVLSLEVISIDQLVNETSGLIEAFANQKNISIVTEVKAKTIVADANMLKTVLRNLLNNAIKFSYPHSEVKLIVEDKGDSVYFAVNDKGVGLNSKQKENLFNLDSITVTKGTLEERGTGLGLLICKDFVEMHNGQIGVETKQGEGSVFWLIIPKQINT